jgi:signal transduction histidine kinase/CheY-like chemotaxis protein
MNPPKVLVVDDNPTDLEFVVAALSDAKYALVAEVDSRRALKRFEHEGPWHLVISDLKMPGIDGLTLLKEVKARDPLVEAIVLTGHADTGSAVEALGLGAFGYLTKPVNPRELLHNVARALERHRLTVEQRRLIRELEDRDARRGREIATIASMGDALSRMEMPSDLSDDLLGKIAIALGAEAVAFFLRDEASHNLVLMGHHGLPQAILDVLGQRPVSAADCTRRCPILIEKDASLDPRLCPPAFRAADVSAFLSVPVESQDEVVGCMAALILSQSTRTFTSEDREFLEAAGHLIGNAIEAMRREQQARDAEKLVAVGELAAGVAHELGNALAVVSGAVQFLLAKTDEASPSRPYLEVIHRNVAAGDRIIKGLLSFARPSPPCLDATNIEPILEEACLFLKEEMAKAGIEVCRHYWPGPLQVFADAQQMEQVFLNILLNAVQALPRGGTITLRTVPEPLGPPSAGVRIEIADTGDGIPLEYLRRVFDPFFTTKEGGTGLGLSLSRRIVAAHGGELGVESQEGRGSRFTIRLPMVPSASPPGTQAGRSNSAAAPDHGRAA